MRGMIVVFFLSWLTLMTPGNSEGYRILGVFPFHGKSHFMMFEALMKGLARKGHQVDVISPFPLKKSLPNYTDLGNFDLKLPRFVNNLTYEGFHALSSNIVQAVATQVGTNLCEGLGLPEVSKIIHNPPKNSPYNLVITEVFGAHCFMALGPHLKVPTIGMSSSALYPWGNGIIGNPANLAFVPNNLLNYVAPMTFWERLINTVHAVYSDLMFQYYSSFQDEIIKKYFGEDAPSVRECERSLALVLANSHPALNGPKPVTPALVEVGGLHVQEDDSELPRDLKDWMDTSTDGFVYFTFGSMVTIESFPLDVLDVFYKSLGKIAPIRVLIKIPEPEKLPAGLPKNIRTFAWASQFKILKHKNIKAFITHGGLMGTQEAVHYAVPMIGMPLFADQFINVDLLARKKIAVKLDYRGITEEKMDHALDEILNNPIYKETIDRVSHQFLDRPMTSMETAIFWVEYVIRNGAGALRSPAMNLTWWQIELLDVYATISVIALSTIFILFYVSKFLVEIFIYSNPSRVSRVKKIQ